MVESGDYLIGLLSEASTVVILYYIFLRGLSLIEMTIKSLIGLIEEMMRDGEDSEGDSRSS